MTFALECRKSHGIDLTMSITIKINDHVYQFKQMTNHIFHFNQQQPSWIFPYLHTYDVIDMEDKTMFLSKKVRKIQRCQKFTIFWWPPWILGMTLTFECLNSYGIGFTTSKTIEIDTRNEFISLLVQNIEQISILHFIQWRPSWILA